MTGGSAPVTVFGGTGYLGRHVVKVLREADYPVRVASRGASRRALPAGVTAVPCDIRNEERVRAAVDGATAVINAVSLYHEQGGASFDQIHVRGAQALARACAEAGVGRLVLVSGIGASEDSASAYVRARGAGERVTWEQFEDATVLRPSVLFDEDGGFVANLEQLTRAPLVPLFGRGQTRVQPAHVADVAEAAVQAIRRDEAKGRAYELGGGRYSFRECVNMDLAHRGRKRLVVPVPFLVWHLLAAVLGRLPEPPLTRDQVILMKADNVVAEDAPSFRDLDIEPRTLADSLGQG